MALDARTRSPLFDKFARLLGDHDANALMSEFPSVEADELVTKDHLRAELTLTRTELRAELALTRTELREEIGSVRTELREQIGSVRTELREEISALRLEMSERFHRQTAWLTGTVVVTTAVVVAAIPLLS